MVASDRVNRLLNGRVGQFWEWSATCLESTALAMTGSLKQSGDLIEVVVAATDDVYDYLTNTLDGQRRPAPLGLLGVLEQETVLLTGLNRIGPSMRGGDQPMLNTVRYEARNMVVGIYRPERVISPDLRSGSVVFPGVLGWAAMESLKVDYEFDANNLIDRGHIDLLPIPPQPRGRIRPGLTVGVDVNWATKQDAEQWAITTGLEVRCSFTEPTKPDDIVRVLGWVQFALVLAHHGWVAARPGSAEPHLTRGTQWPRMSPFWAGRLMEPPSGAAPPDHSFPFFSLSHLGGAAGLARWVRICEENPRVVEPLLAFHRSGLASVYDHLISMCSTIEYWAASWESRPGWGPVRGAPSGGIGRLHVVAARLGSPWVHFVGDVTKWASYVWEAYLSAKHYRPSGRQFPPQEFRTLTGSVEVLLTAALLDAAADSKKVSRSMLDHPDLHNLSEQMRAMTT